MLESATQEGNDPRFRKQIGIVTQGTERACQEFVSGGGVSQDQIAQVNHMREQGGSKKKEITGTENMCGRIQKAGWPRYGCGKRSRRFSLDGPSSQRTQSRLWG